MVIEGQHYNVIDAPGTYSLEPLDEAAKVAVNLLDVSQSIINVVDATHLERHLALTIELLAQNKPMVVALNMSDEARHKGIEINIEKLVRKLGIPVIATVARTGEGVKRLIGATLALAVASPGSFQNQTGHPGHHPHIPLYNHEEIQHDHQHLAAEDVWSRVGDIVSEVQRLHHHHHTFGELLEDISVHPVWGGFIAAFVLIIAFAFIRLIGEFFIGGGIGIFGEPWIVLPFGTEFLFDITWKPLLEKLSGLLQEGGFLHQLLIGKPINGEIDFIQSFGLLTSL
jgi:ferrous iron transport protein B